LGFITDVYISFEGGGSTVGGGEAVGEAVGGGLLMRRKGRGCWEEEVVACRTSRGRWPRHEVDADARRKAAEA
jgi:hypothetical protein